MNRVQNSITCVHCSSPQLSSLSLWKCSWGSQLRFARGLWGFQILLHFSILSLPFSQTTKTHCPKEKPENRQYIYRLARITQNTILPAVVGAALPLPRGVKRTMSTARFAVQPIGRFAGTSQPVKRPRARQLPLSIHPSKLSLFSSLFLSPNWLLELLILVPYWVYLISYHPFKSASKTNNLVCPLSTTLLTASVVRR
jgi:hypothetical protein